MVRCILYIVCQHTQSHTQLFQSHQKPAAYRGCHTFHGWFAWSFQTWDNALQTICHWQVSLYLQFESLARNSLCRYLVLDVYTITKVWHDAYVLLITMNSIIACASLTNNLVSSYRRLVGEVANPTQEEGEGLVGHLEIEKIRSQI